MPDIDSPARVAANWALNVNIYNIETAIAGADSVTCITAAQAANMTAGQYAWIGS